MKKVLAILMCLTLLLGTVACASSEATTTPKEEAPAAQTQAPAATESEAKEKEPETASAEETADKLDLQPGDTIGIAFNSQSAESWIYFAKSLEEAISEAGYTPLTQWAEFNVDKQIAQIQNMVLAGAKVIIVCPYDNASLSTVLKEAREAGVVILNFCMPVIGTDEVDYFVGYDNRTVGVMQAEAIIDALGLDEGAQGPFTIELFAGSLNEINCYYYFDGAVETLAPYFESGQLVCKSGEMDIEQCTILDWDLTKLITKLDARMTAYYSDGTHLDAVLCPVDYFAGPIAMMLRDYGYGTEDCPMAVITGNDCFASVCKLIANDVLYMTVLKDPDVVAKGCMDVINSLVNGTEVENVEMYQPDESFDYELRACFYPCTSVTKENLQELIIDSGYYPADEVLGDLAEEDFGMN